MTATTQYVSIKDRDGGLRTFVVTSAEAVERIAGPA
jgi:hypothetical protein